MKKIYLIIALISCVMIINAQEQENQYKNDEFKTIFGGKQIGGYGGLGAGYTMIDDKNALVFNARGAVILNHWLAMGLAGSGFVSEKSYYASLNDNINLTGGYGGFFIEPIIFPKSGIHLSIPIVAGMGGISFSSFKDQNNELNNNGNILTSQTFFILEPGLELEFNLFKFMRMSAFATYKYAANLNWEYTPSTALDGLSVGLNLKFGKF
jgi:hypothetical protein